MPLKITKASDPIQVTRLNLCIYAQPGVGKTSLAFTADGPLLLDTDSGAYRAANRKDIVAVSKWADIAGISAADLEPYKTVVLDTAGRALDLLAADIIAGNPKMGNGGALSLKGFGELKSRFSAFLKLLNSFGKDVVLVCHMDEQRNGDDVIERLDAQGGSKNEIYKTVDAMGRIFVRSGKRVLDFSPREGSFGKNPGQLEPQEIPHPAEVPHFLGETIALIKTRLNQITEEQRKAQEAMSEWIRAIDGLSTLADINQMVPQVRTSSEAIRGYFHKHAKDKGFTFNKATKLYEPEAQHVSA